MDLHQVGKPAFKEALIEVLTDPKYTATAQAMSVKIRARKRTPVQEAAGILSSAPLALYQRSGILKS